MTTGVKQQAERNIVKHENYIKFIKKYYRFSFREYIPMIRLLIRIERKKVRD